MTAGRPTDYTQELADLICSRLACGESLRSIGRDVSMPSCVSMFAWMRKYPEFLNQYTRAKEESADALIEDSLDIADNGAFQDVQIDGFCGTVRQVTAVGVAHAKLQIETRKWLASKLKPKKYGDKITTEHSGSVSIERIERVIIKPNE